MERKIPNRKASEPILNIKILEKRAAIFNSMNKKKFQK